MKAKLNKILEEVEKAFDGVDEYGKTLQDTGVITKHLFAIQTEVKKILKEIEK